MIGSLKKKFIICAMAAVTVLLLVLVGAVNILNYIITDRQTSEILSILTTAPDGMIEPPKLDNNDRPHFMKPMNTDTIMAARYFIVRLDYDGNIININLDRISAVDETDAEKYAAKVLTSGKKSGKISGYKYAFRESFDGRALFFLDISSQSSNAFMVFILSAVIMICCWLMMFMFVVLLSHRAIMPVVRNIEKQKQFITNAGHELKTPLAVIQSNIDAFELYNGENKWSKNIRSQTIRLNGLMQNLLTLAKLDEKVSLPCEDVNVSVVSHQTLNSFRAPISEKQISVTENIAEDITLNLNSDVFSQLLSILIDNAVKYTDTGGFFSFILKKDGKAVLIELTNSCSSIPNADPERLFERFFRADPSRTSSASAGYGIGLSAARSICESFGGSLTASYLDDHTIQFTARF